MAVPMKLTLFEVKCEYDVVFSSGRRDEDGLNAESFSFYTTSQWKIPDIQNEITFQKWYLIEKKTT